MSFCASLRGAALPLSFPAMAKGISRPWVLDPLSHQCLLSSHFFYQLCLEWGISGWERVKNACGKVKGAAERGDINLDQRKNFTKLWSEEGIRVAGWWEGKNRGNGGRLEFEFMFPCCELLTA